MAAKSVIDVILGEAKGGSFEDMLAIASVIENRSRQLGVTPDQVVSVQSEFNAYGKALPPGVAKHRGLAEKALGQVRKDGPTHNATFYATPAASKNLPSGLSKVTSTDGHVFYNDPKNRSIRTAQGFKQPQSSLLSFASEGPTPPQAAPRTGQEAISAALTQEAPLRSRAVKVAEDNSGELPPMPALDQAFDFPLGDKPQRVARGFAYGPEHYEMDRMNPEAAYAARRAFDNLGIDPQINSGFRSGVRPAGAKFSYNTAVGGAAGSQHRHGNALDISVKGMDNQERAALVDALMAEGMGGIGVGETIVHADTGPVRNWTYNNTMPSEVRDVIDARTEGGRLNRYPSDFGNIPAPSAKPVADFSVGPPTRNGPRRQQEVDFSVGPPTRQGPRGAPAPISADSDNVQSMPTPASDFSAVAPSYKPGLSLSPSSIPAPRSAPRAPAAPTPSPHPETMASLSNPGVNVADAYGQYARSRSNPGNPLPKPGGMSFAGNIPAPAPRPYAAQAPVPQAKPQRMAQVATPPVPMMKPKAPEKPRVSAKNVVRGALLGGAVGGVPGAVVGGVGSYLGQRALNGTLGMPSLPRIGSIGGIATQQGFQASPYGAAVTAASQPGATDADFHRTLSSRGGGGGNPSLRGAFEAQARRNRGERAI